MSDIGEALPTFIAESRSLLEEMEAALLRLEEASDDGEAINAVFRAAHTIKGSAGLFGLDEIVAFTHRAETVLDKTRDGHIAVTGDLTDLLLECCDHISRLITLLAEGQETDSETRERGEALSARLDVYLGNKPGAAVAKTPVAAEGAVSSFGGGSMEGDTTWHISLRFNDGVLRDGMDPLSFLRYLAGLGKIVHVTTLADTMPPLAEMDPECCYLGFEIRLESSADKARIESVFAFVRHDCQIRIIPPGSKAAEYIRLMDYLTEDKNRLGEILVACGAITQRELEEVLLLQERKADASQPVPIGEVLVNQGIVRPEVVDAALTKQQDIRTRQTQETSFIRVQADKLDVLINLVGELVIGSAGVSMLALRNKDSVMLEAVSVVSRLVEDIRDGAMRLRMVEIGETFNRFKRVVRDVSKNLGKDIDLVINGADTELDKSVVDKIGDPLTHLIRNSMDHGIESAEVRRARGKPEKGTVGLNAYHESGSIVIEVSDDGGGLNRDKILAKARERGLVAADANPPDEEVWKLIFEAGFTTAEQVSNLSGRGVGMDVVRRNIEMLRGVVEIDSTAGVGSVFRIRLPLTLAIIDGFLMAIGSAHYVVPLDAVLECVELSEEAARAASGRDYLNLRGEVLPLLRLRDHFSFSGRASRRQNVVVVKIGGRKAGLVVDELKGELQAVIKPLGRLFSHLRGIAGSTILGSGEVALVLDVMTLIDDAVRQDTARIAKAS